MNKYTAIWTVAVLMLAFSFLFLLYYGDAEHKRAFPSEVALNSEIKAKMEELDGAVQQLALSYQTLVEETRIMQSRLNDAVASQEERIKSAEAIRSKPNERLGESNSVAQVSALESGNHELSNGETNKVNEREMSRWMDDVLSAGYLDDTVTGLATEQVESSIAKQPGMQLVDMLCSERFCRASFAMEDGKLPDIGNLLGVPPFVNEGFSVNKPDGTVTIYFTDAGVSLSDLQIEASQEQINYY